MDDAGVGGDDGEVVESGLAPAEEGVALFVALEFQERVCFKGLCGAELVDLYRVIDDQLDGLQRIDRRRIATEIFHGVAHGRQVYDAGHAGEVLQEDSAGSEGDFFFLLVAVGVVIAPCGESVDVFGADVASVFGAQEIF